MGVGVGDVGSSSKGVQWGFFESLTPGERSMRVG